MAYRDQYMLAHVLRRPYVERFEGARWRNGSDNWPLHITLTPWFTLHANYQAADKQLDEISSRSEPIPLVVGDRERFGEHLDVDVNVIEQNVALYGLHNALAQGLISVGAKFEDERWMYEHYRPHITNHSDRGLWVAQGSQVVIDDFQLIYQLGDTRIKRSYALRGQANDEATSRY